MQQTHVVAELKQLHSPDVRSLREFCPSGPFGILVQAMIGPAGIDGEESFDVVLCTPEWLGSHMAREPMPGRHYLFVSHYNYARKRFFMNSADPAAAHHGGMLQKN